MKSTVLISSVPMLLLLLLGCGLSRSDGDVESSLRVTTSLGTIEGYYKTSSSGRRYKAYEGIPYAQPPIGELRFEIPIPISAWTGVLMAKQYGPPCLQYSLQELDPIQVVQGSEDCLYMNIYVSITNDSSTDHQKEIETSGTNLQPVIFYIHGGAFQFGSASDYGSKYLLDRSVTLVTINYRIGLLGFLSTEDETVPGNMGLKDQVIALRWVKDNIRSFGGDPSRITIFGQSAGGASVHYHYLTNLTRGLFQGGMSLSGTALNCWAQTENSLEKAKKVATIVECPTDNIRHMVDCLKDVSAHRIVETVENFRVWMHNPYAPFGPVVEKGGGEFTFIDRPPIEIITSGAAHEVPWITGVVSEEGLYPAGYFIANDTIFKELNDNWEAIAPHLLDFNYTMPKTDHSQVARLIRRHYVGTSPLSRLTANQTVQMVGDRLFVHDAMEAARLQARTNRSPVRFYYFSYRGTFSESDYMSGTKENFGASHEDDLLYVLEAFFDTTTTPQDREIQTKLIDLWESFTRDGTPNVGVEWPAVSRSSEEFLYLHIAGPKRIRVKESTPSFAKRNFWRAIGFYENLNNNQTVV